MSQGCQQMAFFSFFLLMLKHLMFLGLSASLRSVCPPHHLVYELFSKSLWRRHFIFPPLCNYSSHEKQIILSKTPWLASQLKAPKLLQSNIIDTALPYRHEEWGQLSQLWRFHTVVQWEITRLNPNLDRTACCPPGSLQTCLSCQTKTHLQACGCLPFAFC